MRKYTFRDFLGAVLYVCGVALIILSLGFLAQFKRSTGSIFPQSGKPVWPYLIFYGTLVLGIASIGMVSSVNQKIRRYHSTAPTLVRAKVLQMEYWMNDIWSVSFETEKGDVLRLHTRGVPDYKVDDIGTLAYKLGSVVHFETK